MSVTYARDRLIRERPFNTGDIEEIARLLDFPSPRDFITAADTWSADDPDDEEEPTTA
jgi:hypothetical protein